MYIFKKNVFWYNTKSKLPSQNTELKNTELVRLLQNGFKSTNHKNMERQCALDLLRTEANPLKEEAAILSSAFNQSFLHFTWLLALLKLVVASETGFELGTKQRVKSPAEAWLWRQCPKNWYMASKNVSEKWMSHWLQSRSDVWIRRKSSTNGYIASKTIFEQWTKQWLQSRTDIWLRTPFSDKEWNIGCCHERMYGFEDRTLWRDTRLRGPASNKECNVGCSRERIFMYQDLYVPVSNSERLR